MNLRDKTAKRSVSTTLLHLFWNYLSLTSCSAVHNERWHPLSTIGEAAVSPHDGVQRVFLACATQASQTSHCPPPIPGDLGRSRRPVPCILRRRHHRPLSGGPWEPTCYRDQLTPQSTSPCTRRQRRPNMARRSAVLLPPSTAQPPPRAPSPPHTHPPRPRHPPRHSFLLTISRPSPTT